MGDDRVMLQRVSIQIPAKANISGEPAHLAPCQWLSPCIEL